MSKFVLALLQIQGQWSQDGQDGTEKWRLKPKVTRNRKKVPFVRWTLWPSRLMSLSDPYWFSPGPCEWTSHHGTGCFHLAFIVFIWHCSLNSLLSLTSPPYPYRTRQTRRGSQDYHQKPNPVFCGNPLSRWDEVKKKSGHFQHQLVVHIRSFTISKIPALHTEKLSLRKKQFSYSFFGTQ